MRQPYEAAETVEDEEFERSWDRVAAIDVAKASGVACGAGLACRPAAGGAAAAGVGEVVVDRGPRSFEGALNRFLGGIEHLGYLARVVAQNVAQHKDGALSRRQQLQGGDERERDRLRGLVAGLWTCGVPEVCMSFDLRRRRASRTASWPSVSLRLLYLIFVEVCGWLVLLGRSSASKAVLCVLTRSCLRHARTALSGMFRDGAVLRPGRS